MTKTASFLILALVAASTRGDLTNEIPDCAKNCDAYSTDDSMSNINDDTSNIMTQEICNAYYAGLCAQSCSDQAMEACTPSSGTGAICFAGDSLLTLEDGTTKTFHEIQVNTCSFLVDWSCFGSRLRSFNSFFYTVCLLLFICPRLCFCTRPGGR